MRETRSASLLDTHIILEAKYIRSASVLLAQDLIVHPQNIMPHSENGKKIVFATHESNPLLPRTENENAIPSRLTFPATHRRRQLACFSIQFFVTCQRLVSRNICVSQYTIKQNDVWISISIFYGFPNFPRDKENNEDRCTVDTPFRLLNSHDDIRLTHSIIKY